jgi:hypothetical protein
MTVVQISRTHAKYLHFEEELEMRERAVLVGDARLKDRQAQKIQNEVRSAP